MKQLFLSLAVIATLAFTSKITGDDKAAATVNQVQGLYLFIDSKPVKDYQYLGTVNAGAAVGLAAGQYQAVRDRLLKKIKKEYPDATGAIFNFNKGGTDKADAIKFKE